MTFISKPTNHELYIVTHSTKTNTENLPRLLSAILQRDVHAVLLGKMASDPRRHDRVTQYKEKIGESLSSGDHFNALGMLFSLVGLLLKVRVYYCTSVI